jgi:hypothetical protein
LREDVEIAKGLCPPFDPESYRAGHLTPVYFGSALNNFGVRELLAGVAELVPPPRPQPADRRPIAPEEPRVFFKVQANIGPATPRPHRFCAHRLGPASARHETEEHPHRPGHVGACRSLSSRARAIPLWRPCPATSLALPVLQTVCAI